MTLFQSESIRKPSHDNTEHSTVMLCFSLERKKWKAQQQSENNDAATQTFFAEIKVFASLSVAQFDVSREKKNESTTWIQLSSILTNVLNAL